MLYNVLIKNKARKTFNRENRLDISIEKEIRAFERLQEIFKELIFLVYYNSSRRLYINVDAFK